MNVVCKGWLWLLLLAVLLPGARAQVIINEVMANNDSAVDNNGNFPDWIELYNPSVSSVNVGGWRLTDDTNSPAKFVFPPNTLMDPNSYLVIWCDSETNSPGFHSDFSLKNDGELAALYDSSAVRRDLIVFGLQIKDLTIGRVPNGSGTWNLTQPTPALANVAVTLGSQFNLKFNEWMATNSAGADEDWVEVYNADTNPVALGGLVFTDTPPPSTPSEPAIPALSFIPGGEFIKFKADSSPNKGADHLDFKLSSSSGETITIYTSNRATIIDSVTFGPQTGDVSQGRLPDGAPPPFQFFPVGRDTPGASNFIPLTNVVINEVLTHTDPPFEDAIELHNVSGSPVDVGNWWISNNKDDPKKFRIPSSTVISAGGYKVFYEYQLDPDGTGNSPSFRFNSAHGDDAYLFSGDASGTLTGYRAHESFGAAENGVSFGRYTTSEGKVDFTAMAQKTFGMDNPADVGQFRLGTGLPNSGPKVGPVVINELMYHPPDIIVGTNSMDNDLDEYIELRNIASTNVPLYDPNAATNTWKLDKGVEFTFPQFQIMTPGSYLLVVNFNPTNTPLLASFRSKYSVPMSVPIFGPYNHKLGNSGENVELYKPDPPQLPPHPDAGFVPFVLADKVKYDDKSPWAEAADGEGPSLQRRDSTAYGNDPANWVATPATAGKANVIIASVVISSWEKPGSFVLHFTAAAGASYAAQYRNSLSTGDWVTFATVPAQGTAHVADVTDSGASAANMRFYRLISPAP